MRPCPSFALRRGFSLVELLVVIAVIGILVAMLLPAVQAGREAARRSQCSNNLAQLAIAITQYHEAHGVYPPGTIDDTGPIRSVAQGYHHNWILQLLPYLERQAMWRHLDVTRGVYDPANAPLRSLTLNVLLCPSDNNAPNPPASSYAGVHHDVEAPIDVTNNGVFFLNSRIGHQDIRDGASNTLFVGEKILPDKSDLGWMSGTRATLRNTGRLINSFRAARGATTLSEQVSLGVDFDEDELGRPFYSTRPKAPPRHIRRDPALEVGGFSSHHPGGAQFVVGDGSVNFIAETVDPDVFSRLGHRDDGELIQTPF